MKKFYQQSTTNTPEIKGDHISGKITIKGNSFPEDYQKVFYKFQQWLNQLYKQDVPQIHLGIELKYLNSTTAIFLSEVCKQLKTVRHAPIQMKWYYNFDDKDTKAIGVDLRELYGDFIELREKKMNHQLEVEAV